MRTPLIIFATLSILLVYEPLALAEIAKTDVYYCLKQQENVSTQLLDVKFTEKFLLETLLPGRVGSLQLNPMDGRRIFLLGSGPTGSNASWNLHVSLDSGASWRLVSLPAPFRLEFDFHWSRPELALARDVNALYLTQDGGLSWSLLSDCAAEASWGSNSDSDPKSIYILRADCESTGTPAPPTGRRSLWKSVDLGVSWRFVSDNLHSGLAIRGSFLFVHRDDPGVGPGARRLEVSTDFGATFHRTSLPGVLPSGSLEVLDAADGVAFVHADNGGSGHGTLYRSDPTGRLHAKSLERHRKTSWQRATAIPGTYLAAVALQGGDGGLERSVITHNWGATWETPALPAGAACSPPPQAGLGATASEPCTLQLSPFVAPQSAHDAPGLLVAHGSLGGHLAKSVDNLDVYISRDGGYTWAQALSGPHQVVIASGGGLLVAAPISGGQGFSSPPVVRFSVDAGRCWHSYAFAKPADFRILGLLSSRAAAVAIWGQSNATKQWHLRIMDFARLLTRQCIESDYEAALLNSDGGGRFPCVLGARQTVRRLKAGSWCIGGESAGASGLSRTPCACTAEDFACDFGFVREQGTTSFDRSCVRDASASQVEVCLEDGTVRRLVTEGYRKLPRNLCLGGFQPNQTEQLDREGELCSQRQPQPSGQQDAPPRYWHPTLRSGGADTAGKRRSLLGILLPVCVMLGSLLAAALVVAVTARLRRRRYRRVAFHASSASLSAPLPGGGRPETVEFLGPEEEGANGGGDGSSDPKRSRLERVTREFSRVPDC